MKQLKDTLNLPSTKFSMKANLAQKEPGLLDYWKNLNLYQLIKEMIDADLEIVRKSTLI